MKQYQVTLYDKTGSYKPVSCIINYERIKNKEEKQLAINKGITKICFKRNWGKSDLVKYHYTTVKIREHKAGE